MAAHHFPLISCRITHAQDAGMVKCPRCWNWHPVAANHDHLCDRCCEVLVALNHTATAEIRAAFARQEETFRVHAPPAH